jgi:hexosaminidase
VSNPAKHLLPQPVRVTLENGSFEVTPATVIYAESEQLAFSARFVAEHIGLAVGPERLKVQVGQAAPPGAISILRNVGGVAVGPEGYTLSVRPDGITIRADAPAGAFYAVQTLRQLLPVAWEYEALRPPRREAPPITVPGTTISDAPRFAWRGAMLDVARHFLTVEEVKRFIDLMALHKLNRLHLHLADDQGWRIDIRSWANLATHGGSTEVGGGMGGFYTQDQYAAIVRYADERFITVIPEIDMPGHTNAALASYPELNCDNVARPLYTGIEVGFSALCVEKEVTYKFIDDVVREIAALTPGPYFHIGGDEVKTLTPLQYAGFVERVQGIVRSHGKQMIGWDEVAPTRLDRTSIVQYWRPKTSIAEAVAKGAKVIMSVADRMYLDMKYDSDTPIGLTWAGIVSVKASYDWDPRPRHQACPKRRCWASRRRSGPRRSRTSVTTSSSPSRASPLSRRSDGRRRRRARGMSSARVSGRRVRAGRRWGSISTDRRRSPGGEVTQLPNPNSQTPNSHRLNSTMSSRMSLAWVDSSHVWEFNASCPGRTTPARGGPASLRRSRRRSRRSPGRD